MALGASLIGFVFGFAAAGASLYVGSSLIVAFAAYVVVGSVAVVIAVLVADVIQRAFEVVQVEPPYEPKAH